MRNSEAYATLQQELTLAMENYFLRISKFFENELSGDSWHRPRKVALVEEAAPDAVEILEKAHVGYLAKLGILYGSLAQGTHRLDSDVDLAVAKDHREPLDEETLLQLSLEAGANDPVVQRLREIADAL